MGRHSSDSKSGKALDQVAEGKDGKDEKSGQGDEQAMMKVAAGGEWEEMGWRV